MADPYSATITISCNGNTFDAVTTELGVIQLNLEQTVTFFYATEDADTSEIMGKAESE